MDKEMWHKYNHYDLLMGLLFVAFCIPKNNTRRTRIQLEVLEVRDVVPEQKAITSGSNS